MASKFLIDLDLNGNEIQNFGIQTTGTLPASPFNGQVVNHSGVIKVYETSSTSWKSVGVAADGTTITETSGVISVGTIPQSSVTGLSTSLGGKVDDSQVLTNVPSGAVFTDTTYTAGTGIDLSGTAFAVDSTVVVTSGAQTIGGNKTFSNDVTISGDLTVSGSVTTKLSEEVQIEDNLIVLNSNETGTPSEDAGIEVERGTSSNVNILWDESTDRWTFTNDGTNYENLPLASELGGVAAEDVEDIVGAMLTGNVENGITVTYQDSTNDIDFETTHHTYTETQTSYAGGTLDIGGHNLDLTKGAVVQVYDVASANYQQVATDVVLDTTNAEIKVVLPAGDWKIIAHGERA
jgi:hypothetical protein